MTQEIRWLLAQGRPYRPIQAGSLAFTLAGAVMMLLDPLVMRWVIDTLLPARQIGLLGGAVAIFVFTYSSRLAFTSLGNMLAFRATRKMVFRIRLKLLQHLHLLSADWHENAPVGDTLVRLEPDIEQIGDLGGDFILSITQTLMSIVLTVGTMLLLNARLTLVILPLIPAFLLLRRRYYLVLRRCSETVQAEAGRRTAFLQENISGMVQIQLLRQEVRQCVRFAALGKSALDAQIRRRNREVLFGVSSLLVIVCGIGVLLGYGGYQVIRGALTVGGLVAFYTYLIRLFEPLSGAVDIDTRFQRVRASVRRILDVMECRPSVAQCPGARSLDAAGAGRIEFDGVSFGYGAGDILRDISFTIRSGERIALVGRSGSGKSTIGKLLARLYDVRAGVIRIGGNDLRNVTLASLRSAVALVPQDPVLFNGTVRENLLCGNPEASVEEMESAVSMAQVREVVHRLPRGWDEPLGPRGARLSGGERQRLALARALLQQPGILILDESTSALDVRTEKELFDALERFADGRIVIVISHRIPAMHWADRILVMDDGEIVAKGTHRELYRGNSTFREICREADLERQAEPAMADWEGV